MLIDEVLMEDFNDIESIDDYDEKTNRDDLYGYFYDTEVNKYIIHISNNKKGDVIYFNEYDDVKYNKKIYYKKKFYKNMNSYDKFHNFNNIIYKNYDNGKDHIFNLDENNKYTKMKYYINNRLFIITNAVSLLVILVLTYKIWYN
jgi:hypothetical protein